MRRNLKQILADVPMVHEGCRGVSDEVAAVNRYILDNQLRCLGGNALDLEIGRVLGRTWRTVSYSRGNTRRRSTYSGAWMTGASEYQQAKDASPEGLKSHKGMMVTNSEKGVYDQWTLCDDGRRWKRVRRWRKVRGTDLLVAGDARRIGRYSVQAAYDGSSCWIVKKHVGIVTDRNSRTVELQTLEVAETRIQAIRKQVRRFTRRPKQMRVETPITERLLKRLCPDGWEIIHSPASQGDEPTWGFREILTGEEYHYGLCTTSRDLVAQSRLAFRRRAEQRDAAELSAIVDRGEAACVYVCAADSYRAGNCRRGTETFADKHGLDMRRHYRAAELAAQANGDTRFVRAAIIAALRRERRELQVGFAVLADHQG